MKKILIIAILLLGFTTTAQYEDELKMLHEACRVDETNIDTLFKADKYTLQYSDGMHSYIGNDRGIYTVDYSGKNAVASYMEDYNKLNFKQMHNAVRKLSYKQTRFMGNVYYESNEFIYLVSDFKHEDNTMLITITTNF